MFWGGGGEGVISRQYQEKKIGHWQRRLWRLCYCCSIGFLFVVVMGGREGEGVYHYIQAGPGNGRGHWQWRHWISVGVQVMLLLQY